MIEPNTISEQSAFREIRELKIAYNRLLRFVIATRPLQSVNTETQTTRRGTIVKAKAAGGSSGGAIVPVWL